MKTSEFPFSADIHPIDSITKHSHAKEFYLEAEKQTLVKEYDSMHAEDISTSLRLFNNSKIKIERFIPVSNVVIGKNPQGEKKTFLVMEHVTGTQLSEIQALTPDQQESLDEFLIKCFEFAAETGKFPDIIDIFDGPRGVEITNFDNIIVGTTKSDSENKPYLVDIWPIRSVEWQEPRYFAHGVLEAIRNVEQNIGQEICPKIKEYLRINN